MNLADLVHSSSSFVRARVRNSTSPDFFFTTIILINLFGLRYEAMCETFQIGENYLQLRASSQRVERQIHGMYAAIPVLIQN